MSPRAVVVAICITLYATMVALAVEPIAPRDGEPFPLPKFLTADEARLPLPPVVADRAPPVGQIHCSAEYEPMAGLLVAWRAYPEVLTPMCVSISNLDPSAKVWVVVNSASEQASVASTLTSAGANMSRIVFIINSLNSVWIRDYGPRYIFVDGIRSIVDHTYNRPRPLDNAFNDYLATLWGEPQYDLPLVHGGGNFHLFADGDAFMTRLILTENPGVTEQQVKDTFLAYQNVNLTLFDGFPTSFDSTQHIDMWMLPVANKKIIIGQYASSTGQPYTITEGAKTLLESRGYTVYRTPGWRSTAHYTYTNAVIFNNLVFVSKFNVAEDSTALAVFQSAFPGKTHVQVPCQNIIGAAGAIHCVVMHVPAYPPQPEPVVLVTQPNGGETWTIGSTQTVAWTAYDDVGVTSIDIHLSRDGGAAYTETLATGLPNSGTYNWTVTGPNTTQARVRVVAHDGDGNSGADDSNANFTITANGPRVIYGFPLNTSPGWTTQGQWAFGQPTGQGGTQHGFPDPASGFTGTNVYGVNLSGDYSTTVGGPWYVTTGPLDLDGVTSVKLRFRRWLNSDFQPYVYAYVEGSSNGTTWATIWQNGTAEIAENTWSLQEYNIAALADNQPAFRLRWGYRVGSSAWAYSGWNIDDVELIGIPTLTPGDTDCDGDIDFDDIDPFIAALSGEAAYLAQYPDCYWLNADCNGDGLVDFNDIDAFVSLLGG
ncbi:MAG: agmatine deiminase family protein [Phycisphaerales bacterium]|nr:agmatine deiminase family protein [Phycisphaerales bacterium]